MAYIFILIYIHPFIHLFIDDAVLKCNGRAHPRIAAPKRVFAPRARDTVLYCALACLARARVRLAYLC